MRTRNQCLVDSAVPYNQIEPFINSGLILILITHSHHDHIAYLNDYIKHHPNLVVVCHPTVSKQLKVHYPKPVEDGNTVTVGQLSVDVLHTEGHNLDSICYLVENIIFTGDTLFVGRTGRTVSAGSNTDALYKSVYEKLLTLPEETIIYPGHDYGPDPSITIGENIKISPLLRADDKTDFKKRMADFETNRT